MISMQQSRLVRRYAQAFLNLYGERISDDVIDNVSHLIAFFEERSRTVFFLKLTSIPASDKKRIVTQICEQHQLDISPCSLWNRLLALLTRHNRLFLFENVLQRIVAGYRERHNIMLCELSSSPALSDDEQHAVMNFIARKSGKKIMYDYQEDPHLIAGVRVQSDRCYWESSIARQFREMRHRLRAL